MESIDRQKGALKVEKCIAYTMTFSICEYYHLGALRGGMTAAQVTPSTAMASRGRARDTGSARLPQVAPSRRRAREGSPPGVAQDDARARTSRRCCARRMVGGPSASGSRPVLIRCALDAPPERRSQRESRW